MWYLSYVRDGILEFKYIIEVSVLDILKLPNIFGCINEGFRYLISGDWRNYLDVEIFDRKSAPPLSMRVLMAPVSNPGRARI